MHKIVLFWILWFQMLIVFLKTVSIFPLRYILQASFECIGSNYAVFEPVHGTAPDIAGKGIANPLATILSSIMMLNHIGMEDAAIKLNKAVLYTLSFPENRMRDMGGKLKTKDFINKIISNIKN